MAAFLRWIEQNDEVPQRKLRDWPNPLEFYNQDELVRYRAEQEDWTGCQARQ